MTRHHSPPHVDPEDEPTVPTVYDLGFRPAPGPGRVLAFVVLTIVLCGLALWMALGSQEAMLREDPGASEMDRD